MIKGNSIENLSNASKIKLSDDINKNEISDEIFESPVYNIKRINVDDISANNYNPNSVATEEMKLLKTSIMEDGYTMPITVSPDPDNKDKYIIIDGFHRWTLAKFDEDIRLREKGTVPCTVLNKTLHERIGSTIRMNRARGTHDVSVMANIVSELVQAGLGDDYIRRNLGMEKEEILRLKQVSGLSSLFKDEEFSKSWIVDD